MFQSLAVTIEVIEILCVEKCSELTDEDVRTAIKNSGGVKGSLLIPEAPFELLVRRAISRLLPSALQCQQFVHAELLRIASQCAPADVTRFPNLQVCSFRACCVMCGLNTQCNYIWVGSHLIFRMDSTTFQGACSSILAVTCH